MSKSSFLSYKFVDSKGNLRDKVISPSAKSAMRATGLEPTWFDGSSFGFTPTSKSDLLLVPQPETMFYDPIRGMDSVFCFLENPDGSSVEGDFRTIALNTESLDSETKGALFGVEPEFFLLSRTSAGSIDYVPYNERDGWVADGVTQYQWYGALPPIDQTQDIRHAIVENLETTGIEVESCHHEVAPGQAEISWRCDTLLRTCDKMLLAKYIIHATAAQYKDDYGRRVAATFGPKPFENLNGNGCHVHQSIPSMRDDEEVLIAYAQGLVDNYDELHALCNSHVDSSKRLVEGYEAPTKDNNGFGFCDRTKTIRIPAGGGRLEYRLPDPMMNPYAALTRMLQLGRANVKEKLGI